MSSSDGTLGSLSSKKNFFIFEHEKKDEEGQQVDVVETAPNHDESILPPARS